MEFAGPVREIKKWFNFALDNKVKAIYMLPGGHLFALYESDQHFYVRTSFLVSHNLILRRASLVNLLHFFSREGASIRIHDHVTVRRLSVTVHRNPDRKKKAGVSEETFRTFTLLEKDLMYSEASQEIKLLTVSERDFAKDVVEISKQELLSVEDRIKQSESRIPQLHIGWSDDTHADSDIYWIGSNGERLVVFNSDNTIEHTFDCRFRRSSLCEMDFPLPSGIFPFLKMTNYIHDNEPIHIMNLKDAVVLEYHRDILRMKIHFPK